MGALVPRLLAASLLSAVPAAAQVAVNLDALNPPQPKAGPAPPAKPRVHHVTRPVTASPAAPVVAAVPRPALPTGTPPEVRLAPTPLTHAEAAVTAPRPASPAADGSVRVETAPQIMRLRFAPGVAALTGQAAAEVKTFAAAGAPGGTFDVRAYASGPADDPSTPRRLSLSRATAVYEVLREAGVPSPSIFVRALGTTPSPDSPGADPDRVDLAAHAPPPAPAPATAPLDNAVTASPPAPPPAKPKRP